MKKILIYTFLLSLIPSLAFGIGAPPASSRVSAGVGLGDMLEADWDGDANGFIDTDAGGTNTDSSAATGVPNVNAGTWSYGPTLVHEFGGLEADVGAYNGIIKISGGVTSAVAISANGESLITAANYAAMKVLLDLEIGTDILAEQTIGIGDDNLLEADGTPNSGEYARFTANGLEGRTEAEFKGDFNLEIGTDVGSADDWYCRWQPP